MALEVALAVGEDKEGDVGWMKVILVMGLNLQKNLILHPQHLGPLVSRAPPVPRFPQLYRGKWLQLQEANWDTEGVCQWSIATGPLVLRQGSAVLFPPFLSPVPAAAELYTCQSHAGGPGH